jgi:LPS export ABC transporter protein LptC
MRWAAVPSHSVILGALALTLSACKKQSTEPPVTGAAALAANADQVMFGAKFNLTTSGVSTAYLIADTALFFDDNTRVELERVNTVFYTKTGERDATLTSRSGTYSTPTGMMVARGDVHVVAEDGRDLRTEELKYDQSRNQVSSDSAFVLVDSARRRIEGVGFRSDPNLKNIQILKLLSGTTGAMTLPGQ